MQNKMNLIKSVQTIFKNALDITDMNVQVIALGTTEDLIVSRDDAEVMVELLDKYLGIKNEEVLNNVLKADYDDIPYIIGASAESKIGEFQLMIEKSIH